LNFSGTPLLAAEQQPEPIRSAFSLRFENDAFGGTDANYTNGISMALTLRGKGLLGGVWDLAGTGKGERLATYELTQLQFTPSDLELSNPDPADRPYAGLLYLGCTTHLQREDSLHSLKLMAGIAGPASYAEGLQRFTHRVLGYNLPQGWAYQLKNEPVINLIYEYRHKYRISPRDAAITFEVIPIGRAFLGNYLIQGDAEVQCRVGYHPDDFGTTVLRGIGYLPFPEEGQTHHSWGFYAFAGGAASLVARNLTLDGNTFAESRSVDKRPFLPTAEFGASLWTKWCKTTFSYVMMGREFYGQPEREDYGSILFSYFFR
jgi:lipid A 3-O-deacylase